MANSKTGGPLSGFGFPGLTLAGVLGNFAKRGDLALAIGVMTIIVVLILPMPAFLLDFSLAISITFSVLVLMTALFIQKPLEFSAFPTVLLIATMLRLALNLASTRLILSHGHDGTAAAGKVIEAFGHFVMQGNFVIGVIVFAILIIVNFVVITKGSGRIAEVAARFTLDAMPGKQMAIDADLSAGLIDEKVARQRRSDLENESSFFGAMDGASKFVRGDAVAGLLITFINVVGGIIVGVAQNNLSFADAAQTYTILTVGDGLVSQIPALIVSTAAGLLVSKAGVEGAADQALFEQLSGYPQALGMSSVVMGIMALLPGLPMIPFLLLSAGAGSLAFYVTKARRLKAEGLVQAEAAESEAAPVAEEPIGTALRMDELRLEIGYALLPLINGKDHQKLTDQIKALRRQLAADMGFVMPSVRILDNVQIDSNAYSIRVKEVEAGRGEVYVNQLLVMDPHGGRIELPGLHTTEPAFGLPATWIDEGLREEASFRGYTVVDPPTVLTTHLTEIIRDNMADLLSYAEVQKLIDELGKEHKKLVDDIVPTQITVTGIQRVLQTLLNERISIRDLPTIMEGIAEAVGHTQSLNLITEHVRARLARQICASHSDANNTLPLLTLSPRWEQSFAESLVGQGEEKQLAMQPSKLQEFIASVRDMFEEAGRAGEVPVLLTSPGVRPYVRSIIERFRPQTFVMSQNEIHPRVRLRTVGSI
ncbi:flagellar biosynthesis protein FlhA [Parvibaculum sp.]|uniref:flagellar biosynthesis protein FlhA n=1 Tax=Parvibaculum sp. TaxID=2024848 RepID=UPI002C11B628|nr:flagellar biosynthesis protein FlhA [Parvibaculum sp.]HUD51285.1 flagellar biosynthesis protein FlhA [Parvibaculum sp.]